jgi:hypothetical protein
MAPKVGNPSPAVVHQRLKQSVDDLLDADRKNPDSGSVPTNERGNPWRPSKPGNNGAVDSKEAATTGKTAQAMYAAAAKTWGTKVVEGGGGNWVNKSYAQEEVSGRGLRDMEAHADSIVDRITDANGNISDAKLNQLPQIVNDYWKETFGNDPQNRATPDMVDAIVKLVRTAVDGD